MTSTDDANPGAANSPRGDGEEGEPGANLDEAAATTDLSGPAVLAPAQAKDDPVVASASERVAEAVLRLARGDNESLAVSLAGLFQVIADEAARNRRFAAAVRHAIAGGGGSAQPSGAKPTSIPDTSGKRPNRRAPGVLDPFVVLAEGGETTLRERLKSLDLEQLKDIVAEHGMDHDRLALRWKDPARLVDRIVEKVHSRNAKGAAFRT